MDEMIGLMIGRQKVHSRKGCDHAVTHEHFGIRRDNVGFRQNKRWERKESAGFFRLPQNSHAAPNGPKPLLASEVSAPQGAERCVTCDLWVVRQVCEETQTEEQDDDAIGQWAKVSWLVTFFTACTMPQDIPVVFCDLLLWHSSNCPSANAIISHVLRCPQEGMQCHVPSQLINTR